jgi:diguanylate cyclase (GGDEF)-like protein
VVSGPRAGGTNWERLGVSPGPRYRVAAGIVGLAGFALAWASLPVLASVDLRSYLFFLLLALGGSAIVIHFPIGTTLTMQGSVTLAAVWLFGWAACVPINFLSASLLLPRGLHPWRWLFAWANASLWMAGAGLLFEGATGGVLGPVHGWGEVAVLLAAGFLACVGLAVSPAAIVAADGGSREHLAPRSLIHIAIFIFLSFVPVSYLMALGFLTGGGTGVVLAVAVWILTSLALKGYTETGHANARLEAALTELEELSVTDPLTGLYNRRHLGTVLDREIERHRRHGVELSLLTIDLVGFKQINDRFGHPEGDRMLECVGTAISSRLRGADQAFRWGGDEFAVVLPHTGAEGAHVVAESLAAEIAGAGGDGAPARLAASIGLATFPHHGRTPEALMAAADRALYDARARRVTVAEVEGGEE